ncbi:hypothetical protein SYNTR_0132 [Candidatus Syntrophocurvum alkaliphilum]|uniref:CobQ/CobB/MinD/ParA nucleotide binding domain-containing protein n=1 Tax=Candidatus Syntrophocurvum alkaliphilum TaxID=2293317 RepID=A0A6I6DBA9_9FIRM|nr:hypothetical protein [Candidatus Syntrophocurvum alkaliphilum]QGT98725.1 hypothetical protein SYNTR_0132 [Candidatus Syntrophocurvum alkaliphilum]
MHSVLANNRAIIITGGFGSGKSEYAINLALESASIDDLQTTIVDLDLVNAYFRSREAKDLLAKHGVNALVPSDDVFFSDLPIAGPGVRETIKNTDNRLILDVGGDDMGATALASYCEDISRIEHLMLMVVNPFRPFTKDIKGIEQMIVDIEYSSRLKIHGLISNPNIGPGTKLEQILDKHQVVIDAGKNFNLPVYELAIFKELYKKHSSELDRMDIDIKPIEIYLSPQWLVKQLKED